MAVSDMERMIELVKRGDEWASRALTAEQQVEDLSAEVARLRAGIARVMVTCTDRYAADALLDLLNPTEGETDHADA